MTRGFASDNYAGFLPEMLKAIADANILHAKSYGNDEITETAKKEFAKVFGNDIDVSFVFNGTGANLLGIGCAADSYNSILCADSSHIFVDESTAPETFTGCRLIPLATNNEGKIEIETIKKSIIRVGDEHHPQVKVFSIAQPTEYGTLYTLEELKEIGELLKAHNIVFHMDGARLYNAAVSLKCSLKETSRDIGVDILALGGTKIGLIYGEAVVFFNKTYSQKLKFKHKQSMQLASKTRFISSQFLTLLNKELWRKSASHSNRMAQLLHEKIKAYPQIEVTKPVKVNSIFAIIPKDWIQPLQVLAPFYVWNENTNEVRWMCSFDTEESDIIRFVEKIEELAIDTK